MQHLLKNDTIGFEIKPVFSYTNLEQELEEQKDQDELKCLVFLNCGGHVDYSDSWFMKENKLVVVFDSHRPLNHRNLSDLSEVLFRGFSSYACSGSRCQRRSNRRRHYP